MTRRKSPAPRRENPTPREESSTPQYQQSAVRDQHSTPRDQHSTPLDQHSAPLDQHSTPRDHHFALRGKHDTAEGHTFKTPHAPLPRSFYLRPTLTVARELPGKYLVRKSGRSLLVVRIVEVEAYLGSRDPASHAFRGRTARNDVMFWQGGHLYVYFTYGMHHCCNVVTEKEGKGMAILIRSGEPVAGARAMERRRGTTSPTLLCSGPARLCQALGIDRKQNGTDLCGNEIWIAGETDAVACDIRLGRSTRIGIREGTEHRWRFYIRDNPHVSKARPSGPDSRRGGRSRETSAHS